MNENGEEIKFNEYSIMTELRSFKDIENWNKQILKFTTDEDDELILHTDSKETPKNYIFNYFKGFSFKITPKNENDKIGYFSFLHNIRNNRNLFFSKLQINQINVLRGFKIFFNDTSIFKKYSTQYPMLNYLFEPWDCLLQVFPDNTLSARLRAPIIKGNLRFHTEVKYNSNISPYYAVENLLEGVHSDYLYAQFIHLYLKEKHNIGIIGNFNLYRNDKLNVDLGGELLTKGNTGPGMRISWINQNERLSSLVLKYNVLGTISTSFATQLTNEIDSTCAFMIQSHNIDTRTIVGLRYRPIQKKYEVKVKYDSKEGVGFNYKHFVKENLGVSVDVMNPFTNRQKIGFGIDLEL
eukprot:gene12829-7180_t